MTETATCNLPRESENAVGEAWGGHREAILEVVRALL
jgi:hypothetical protein